MKELPSKFGLIPRIRYSQLAVYSKSWRALTIARLPAMAGFALWAGAKISCTRILSNLSSNLASLFGLRRIVDLKKATRFAISDTFNCRYNSDPLLERDIYRAAPIVCALVLCAGRPWQLQPFRLLRISLRLLRIGTRTFGH